MAHFSAALLASFLTSLIVLKIAQSQRHWGYDISTGNARKIHVDPVPRLGGASIFIAAWISGTFVNQQESLSGHFQWDLFLASVPAFLVGLGEDLTGKLSPRTRLLGMIFAAILLMSILRIFIVRVDITGIDQLLNQAFGESVARLGSVNSGTVWALDWYASPVGSLTVVLLTLIALLSITNGINLIDGLNGLSGICSLLMFLGLGVVATQVGDEVIASYTFIFAGAVSGFVVWNWPRGCLFLGDGGAYLIGFTLGALSIALVQRNAEVSAWFAVLLLIYPLTEVAFSVWRRRIIGGKSIGIPDAAHLHHLIYRRIVPATVGRTPVESRRLRNAFAAPYLWILTSISVFPAVLLFRFPLILAVFTGTFVIGYIWLYVRIVRFRVPSFLIPSFLKKLR